MYNTKMEPAAWALGIRLMFRHRLLFSARVLAGACTVAVGTNTDVPPNPLHPPSATRGPLVRLCFPNSSGGDGSGDHSS